MATIQRAANVRVFVFDPTPDRAWRELLGLDPHFVECYTEGFGVRDKSDGVLSLAREGVVVVHESALNVDIQTNAFRPASLAERGLWIVVISGRATTAPSAYESARVYRRRASVAKAQIDTTFQECFQVFFTELSASGKPDFRVLEPPAWPPHLVAAYLTGRAGSTDYNTFQAVAEDPVWGRIVDGAQREASRIASEEERRALRDAFESRSVERICEITGRLLHGYRSRLLAVAPGS